MKLTYEGTLPASHLAQVTRGCLFLLGVPVLYVCLPYAVGAVLLFCQ